MGYKVQLYTKIAAIWLLRVVDKQNINGWFELEGLDSYYENSTLYLLMGIGSHWTDHFTCILTKLIAF